MGWAVSAIVAALLFTFGLFVSPLYIAVKCYLFMGICILAAIFIGFNPWYRQRAATPRAKLYNTDWVSLAMVVALIVWCGMIRFVQYWLPGGSEPFFHDMSVTYIAGLAILCIVWAAVLAVAGSEKTFVSVIRSFRYWAFGYFGMLAAMVFMLILYEGD